MYCGSLPADITDICNDVLGEKLTGVYLHGSAAMGCFNPLKSDIDIIVVTENSMTDSEKLSLMKSIVILNGRAPAKSKKERGISQHS